MTTPDVDLFDGLETVTTAPETVNPESQTEDSQDAETPEAEEAPVETVSSVPEGAVSVTDFAKHITQLLMRQKFEAGEDMDGSEFTVPTSVYQTVKASRDRIPHVLVKDSADSEPRAYILVEPATAWWLARREKLATRGTGGTRASNRSAEDNLELLKNAVEKNLYAKDRLAMWTDKAAQTEKLVTKYQGFLKDQNVSEETMTMAIQEATDSYNAEKATKEAEKAAKKDSSKAE